jgi:tetratricopeptide (TPR) repeat protein
MPYVEGESLRGRLDREKQLPIDDALRIAGEVADALGFAHQHNVMHRDVKPENILLEGKHAVVADFGVARAIEQAGEARLTETGVAVGTPAYLSPEQASGQHVLDGRSDLYAIGCVLYEMLSGEPPFTGPTAESIVHQHLTVEPLAVTSGRPTIPDDVAAAVAKALAKAPADRYQTAEAFGEAMAAARVRLVTPGGGTALKAAGPIRGAPTRRRRVGIAAVAAAVLIAAVGAVLLLSRRSGAAPNPNRVLVVAFADQTGSGESGALGRMAQDYIIQVLTDAGFAEVVDPLTALAVSQNVGAGSTGQETGDLRALAEEARAGTVVSGVYYAEADSLAIQARITDARDGRLLGTVGPLVGADSARRELVARVGQAVTAALAPLFDADLTSWEATTLQPATYEAYGAYSDGLAAYLRAEGPEDASEAARHFERAVAADPTFSLARLWAAQTYLMAVYWYSDRAKAESLLAPLVESRGRLSRYERCRLDFVLGAGLRGNLSAGYDAARCMTQAAPGSEDAGREVALFTLRVNRPREAIGLLRQLDPDRGLMKQWPVYWAYLAGAYHLLGDYAGELEVARQGRQRAPEDLDILAAEAIALAALGRVDEVDAVIAAMRSVPSRDMLGRFLTLVGTELRIHGHPAAAREVVDESIVWYRSRPLDTEELRAGLADALYRAERWDEALPLYRELAEQSPQNPTYLGGLGKLAARRGDREEALRISEELRQSVVVDVGGGGATAQRAGIAALLGDRDEAVTLLRQALGVTYSFADAYPPHRDVDLEPLYDYPPFQELMRPKG